MSKPLFIPLKGKFYDAFERGEKTVEYRKLGPRWSAETCRVGRDVVLSRGYGKKNRLCGWITDYIETTDTSEIEGWAECYGYGGTAACIEIEIFTRETASESPSTPSTP